MSSDSVLNEDSKSTNLPADVTDDSCDTAGACTTECDSGDWSAQVKQEDFPAVKQEPHDVCCVAFMYSSLLMSVRGTYSPYFIYISMVTGFMNTKRKKKRTSQKTAIYSLAYIHIKQVVHQINS